jgi:hypothetical protein
MFVWTNEHNLHSFVDVALMNVGAIHRSSHVKATCPYVCQQQPCGHYVRRFTDDNNVLL